MSKKQTIFIIIIILLAAGAAYLYFKPDSNQDEYKIYTAEDFPKALQMMTEEILADEIKGLNKEYELLRQEDHIYIRWINIGIMKKRLGDSVGAEEAWQNAISYNPDQHLAYGNLAQLYFYDLKEYEKSEEYYKKTLSLGVNALGLYTSLADLYRYKMTAKRDQIEGLMLEGAAQAADKTIAVDYYVYLAKFFEREGKHQEKAEYYRQKAIEINPEVEEFFD